MSNERVVLIPLLLGLLVAIWVDAQRLGVERTAVSTALIVDYAEVVALAQYGQCGPDTLLTELKHAGVTAVAVEEVTFADALAAGEVRMEVDRDLRSLYPVGSRGKDRIEGLLGKLGEVERKTWLDSHAERVVTAAPWPALRDLGTGLDREAFEQIRAAGLLPVARLLNSPGLGQEALRSQLTAADRLGATLVIFSGDQVLGSPGLLDVTATTLASLAPAWGRIEFAKQKGEEGLAERILSADPPGTYVRVHSITAAEMLKTPAATAVERYRRAAKERNIRALFVRLFLSPNRDLVEANLDYLRELRDALAQAGLTVGSPAGIRWVGAPLWVRLLMVLFGIAPAAAWLLACLDGAWTVGRWLRYSALLGLLLTVAILAAPVTGLKLAALLAGLTFPTLGGRWAWQRLKGRPGGWPAAFATLWGAVGWAVAGGLMVAALLAETRFMLHHDGFAGVKLAHVGPLFAVATVVLFGTGEPGTSRAEQRERWRRFWRQPLYAAHVAAAVAVVLALLLLLLRSGNEGVEVSPLELRFRALLETTLGARPRTKEMLLGHPALWLAGLAAGRGRQGWVGPLLLVGMIGLVSTFNTFCHIHTPLGQSVLRTFHALWIGSLLGALVGWVVVRPERGDG